MPTKLKDWKWRGLPGHFCAASRCSFRLCTDVGKYRVSTVGAYYPREGMQRMEDIGLNRHYETYVFELEGDEVKSFSEIDSDGIELGKKESPYDADKRAEEMHLSMCKKYARK